MLKQKAARLEMRLDPAGVRQRKEEAARRHRRVEARQEASGNACLSGRELAVSDALEAKNSVWAQAAALREAGLDVPLREARALVYTDRLRGLNSWDRLKPPADDPPDDDDPDDGPRDDDPRDGDDTGRFPDYGYDEDEDQGGDEDDGGGSGGSGPSGSPSQPGSPGGTAPLPALTTILIPAATLLGWSAAPADISGYGLTDPDSARDLIAAASHHPRSRWCATILGDDGEAIAHGCATGRHPWTPAPTRAGPGQNQREQLTALLRQLAITPAPIAKGTCGHAHREDRYRPSRKLAHLVRARTATCAAPGCNARATHSELDHTTAYPAGQTDECNLSPLCPRHHHAKHAPGWKLQQPEPGVMRWTLPSGCVRTTTPTRYDE